MYTYIYIFIYVYTCIYIHAYILHITYIGSRFRVGTSCSSKPKPRMLLTSIRGLDLKFGVWVWGSVFVVRGGREGDGW